MCVRTKFQRTRSCVEVGPGSRSASLRSAGMTTVGPLLRRLSHRRLCRLLPVQLFQDRFERIELCAETAPVAGLEVRQCAIGVLAPLGRDDKFEPTPGADGRVETRLEADAQITFENRLEQRKRFARRPKSGEDASRAFATSRDFYRCSSMARLARYVVSREVPCALNSVLIKR